MVRAMIMYGTEVWGWERQAEEEKLQVKFLKWTLGVDRFTPTHIVLEETKRYVHWVKAGNKTIRFEEKSRKRQDKVILRERLEDGGKGEARYKNRWKIKSKEFYERGELRKEKWREEERKKYQ